MNIRFVCCLGIILLSLSVQAQKVKISGVVTDSDEIPIEFASVQVKGTANGAFTDEKGRYSINVSVGDSCTLVFFCLGYNKTQRIIGKYNIYYRQLIFYLRQNILHNHGESAVPV